MNSFRYSTKTRNSNLTKDGAAVLIKMAYKIKLLRLKAGYKSAKKFAIKHKISTIHYWRMENGANPTIVSLMKILAVHKLTIREFFEDIEQIN